VVTWVVATQSHIRPAPGSIPGQCIIFVILIQARPDCVCRVSFYFIALCQHWSHRLSVGKSCWLSLWESQAEADDSCPDALYINPNRVGERGYTKRDSTLTMPLRPSLRHTLGLIGFSALVYLGLSFRGGQNSQQFTPPLEGAFDDRIERSTRIIAVGDLHGDIGNAQKVLEMARVVDSNGNWSGEVDVFVQTGDIIDRCVAVLVRSCITDDWVQWRRHDPVV
jgi:hypothetical protein